MIITLGNTGYGSVSVIGDVLGQVGSNCKARYDSKGRFWTLFSTIRGTKTRISFVDDADTSKSEAPELVDLKITDYCKNNCSFCYQSSHPKGKHADYEVIKHITSALKDLGVFEIAIGGGEPTEHPDFLKIVQDISTKSIKPNFSTRNHEYVANHWPALKDYIGAVGLSVDSTHMLAYKLEALRKAGCKNITVQVVIGTVAADDLEEIMTVCSVLDATVLLLGWKNVGRGKNNYKQRLGVSGLIAVLDSFTRARKHKDGQSFPYWKGPDLSVDTVLAQQIKDWLDANSSSVYYTLAEGDHSMYIDCVNKKIGRSSYEENKNLVNLRYKEYGNSMSEQIKEYFGKL